MFEIKIQYSELPTISNCLNLSIKDVYNYMEFEATLIIEYNNSIFFSEEVAIVEFYWYISRWYKEISSGINKEFVYSTIEYTKPILTFSNLNDKVWVIDSLWRKSNPIAVDETVIFEQVRNFISKVTRLLKSNV